MTPNHSHSGGRAVIELTAYVVQKASLVCVKQIQLGTELRVKAARWMASGPSMRVRLDKMHTLGD